MTKRPKDYQTFFADLKRRNVFKVTAAYGVVAFVVLQAADLLVEGLQLSQDVLTTITVVATRPIQTRCRSDEPGRRRL